ncbi:hypothetical protein HDV00_001886 [Rhizophlyctis rosea]|nr:hypothetical protein HDV00_001886 [Rhizophlyctis rosea]
MTKLLGPKGLEDSIIEHLNRSLYASHFSLRILHQHFLPDKSLLPNHTATRKDTIILVSSLPETNTFPTSPSVPETFVFGMYAIQYTLTEPEPRTIHYIEKIDTTAFGPVFPPPAPSLARATVRGYVSHALSIAAFTGHEASIHVFARPQPQYLFPDSAKHPSTKRVLSEPALIRWWIRTLSATSDELSPSPTLTQRKYWCIPGEDERTATKIAFATLPEGTDGWTWGWPYDVQSNAKAVIPRFPDDAKTKVLKNLDGEVGKVTVKEFEELLQTTGECGFGRISGFLTLVVTPTAASEAGDELGSSNTGGVAGVPVKEFRTAMQALMKGDYSTQDLAASSTGRVAQVLDGLGGVVVRDVLITRAAPIPPVVEGLSPAGGTSVNNLQGLVTRRATGAGDVQALVKSTKTSGDAGKPVVSSVQGLVKRKSSTSAPPSAPINDLQSLVRKKGSTGAGPGEGIGKRKEAATSVDETQAKKRKVANPDI